MEARVLHLFLMILWIWSETALANGQSTHLWITEHALTHLPEGELKGLLTRADLRPMLDNGTMFPDGGYAIFDDYGEIAHWEDFQDDYLEWIIANEPPPFRDEEAQHVFSSWGSGSHGMADQVFDSLFMERSKLYDEAGSELLDSLDTASDVLFVAATQPRDVPEFWTPSGLFVDLYAQQDHEVSTATMESGQTRLAAALVWVALMSELDERVAEYEVQYPWSAAHLFDPMTPGSPPCEGAIIAEYWQTLWERLHEILGWKIRSWLRFHVMAARGT